MIDDNVFVVRAVTPGAAPTALAWGREAGTILLGVNWASPGMFEWRDTKASGAAPSPGSTR